MELSNEIPGAKPVQSGKRPCFCRDLRLGEVKKTSPFCLVQAFYSSGKTAPSKDFSFPAPPFIGLGVDTDETECACVRASPPAKHFCILTTGNYTVRLSGALPPQADAREDSADAKRTKNHAF